MSRDSGPAAEAQHQARRQRPGLVAEVGHLADDDAGLLGDLAADGVLERLPRLQEARPGSSSGPRARRPDDRAAAPRRRRPGSPWVIAMITAGSVRGNSRCAVLALQLVPGQDRLQPAPAAAAEAGRAQPLGQADRVEDQRGLLDPGPGEVRQQVADADPPLRPRRTTASTTWANHTRPSRSPSSTRVPSTARRRPPPRRATQGTTPSTGRTRLPPRPGRGSPGRPRPARSQAVVGPPLRHRGRAGRRPAPGAGTSRQRG